MPSSSLGAFGGFKSRLEDCAVVGLFYQLKFSPKQVLILHVGQEGAVHVLAVSGVVGPLDISVIADDVGNVVSAESHQRRDAECPFYRS